ncbi:leucine-rich repeat domain-containing protein [Simkania sp.]|uniref:leucine-rich repeat domain-containing protein n=1 Tax=Simkania sp. TaxID=34094 RepID=UPI003B52A64F
MSVLSQLSSSERRGLIASWCLFEHGEPETSEEKYAISECFIGINKFDKRRLSIAERKYEMLTDLTSFQKLKAAFASVLGERKPDITFENMVSPIQYYQTLRSERNETLKESRLTLWAVLYDQTPGLKKDDLSFNPLHLKDLTGNEVEELFRDWLMKHQKSLKKVTHLTLSHSGLKTLPPEIGMLSELHSLNLKYNLLEALPKEIGLLRHLRKLDVSRNLIKEIPSEIGNLTELRYLLLGKNQLEEVPSAITKLLKLEQLSLGENRLKGIPSEVGSLNKLQHLDLSYNFIDKVPDEIFTLDLLLTLSIRVNPLKEVPTEAIDTLRLRNKMLIGRERIQEFGEALHKRKREHFKL